MSISSGLPASSRSPASSSLVGGGDGALGRGGSESSEESDEPSGGSEGGSPGAGALSYVRGASPVVSPHCPPKNAASTFSMPTRLTSRIASVCAPYRLRRGFGTADCALLT